MTKPVKLGVGLLAAAAVLVAGVLVAVQVYLTKDRILAWVIPPMEEVLHRQVKIRDAGGGITGLYLDGLDVRTVGADAPLVAAEGIRVGWNPWALLGGKVEVTEVRLVKPRIHIVRLADGALDIDDLIRTPADGAPSGAPPGGGARGGGDAPALDVLVALFSIEDGRVSLEDRSMDPARTYTLDQVESRVADFTLTGPVRFSLSAAVPIVGSGRLRFEGTANPATGALEARATVDGVDLPALNPFLPPGRRLETGSAELSADLVVGEGARVTLTGEGAVRSLVISAGGRKGAVGEVTLTFRAGFDPSTKLAKLDALALSVAGQTLHLSGTAAVAAPRPRIDFLLTSESFATDPVFALLPPGPETEATEGGGDTPSPSASGSGSAAEPHAAVPVDVVGDVEVARLEVAGVLVDGFETHLALLDGVLTVDPVAGGLYGGTIRGTARARLEEAGMPFEATWKAVGVGLAGLVSAAEPAMTDTITGTLLVSGEASGVGGDPTGTRAALHLEAKDGKLVGHPMVNGLGRLFGTREFERLNFYDIRADLTTADRVLDLERFVFDGARLQATGMGTVGLEDRVLDLRLAVAVQKKLARKLVSGAVLDAITDAQGWSRIPLRMKGTVETPIYALDTGALGRAAGGVVEKQAEKLLKKEVLDKIPLGAQEKGALEQSIRSLFGR